MEANTKKPTIFIGSSTEGLEVAYALQSRLQFDSTPTVWNQDFFPVTESSVHALCRQAGSYDFAVMVLTPDDVVQKRAEVNACPRDNVIFELGLFMGAIGRERTFFLLGHGDGMSLPSDLAGVTHLEYDARRDALELESAVQPAVQKIKRQMKTVPPRNSPEGDVKMLELAKTLFQKGKDSDAKRVLEQIGSASVWSSEAVKLVKSGQTNSPLFSSIFDLLEARNHAELAKVGFAMISEKETREQGIQLFGPKLRPTSLRGMIVRLFETSQLNNDEITKLMEYLREKSTAELKNAGVAIIEQGRWKSEIVTWTLRALTDETTGNRTHADLLMRALVAKDRDYSRGFLDLFEDQLDELTPRERMRRLIDSSD